MIGVLLSYTLFGILLIRLAASKQSSQRREIARGLLITHITVGVLSGGLELYFRYFYADSGYPYMVTYASQNWMQRYLSRNTAGYRDREWTQTDLENKQVIIVIGDSFTEGWGIDNPAERYTDVLAQRLGDDYAVINIGRGATDTLTQMQLLQDYLRDHPYIRPNVVIWQYFLNDIQRVAINIQGEFNYAFPERPPLVDESYLLDYLYWQSARLQVGGAGEFTFWDYLYAAYDNSVIWEIHQREITDLIVYVDSLQARLIAVIFPNLQDPVSSIPYVDRVEQAIQATGHDEILKLTDLAAGWQGDGLIVSRYDAHAGVAFNQRVGELIEDQFFVVP
jgi:hypothetical protein